MKRKVEKYLINWKENRNNALIVYGARQVGKSYSIEKFIKENYSNSVIIDFSKSPQAIEMFESFTDKYDFYNRLAFYTNSNDNLIVFFDEIQELYTYRSSQLEKNPDKYFKTVDLITLVKSLVQDNKNRYIFSGSMLGVTLNSINLNPTGYMDILTMYPMDFEEFLWANGIGEELINHLHDKFEKKEPVEEAIHNKMIQLFKEYVLVGGMPAAVEAYIQDHTFVNVSVVQSSISNFYNVDILKYAPKNDKLIISEIYKMLSSEINNINKRFTKTHLDIKNIKNLDLMDKYLWLTNSGIAIPVYNVTALTYPLKLNEERKVLKLFSGDVGMLSNELLSNEGRINFLKENIKINYGAPFENAIAQELTAHGFANLNYYNSKKIGEIDFVIEKQTKIIPIEIKSGKSDEHDKYNFNALQNALQVYKNIDTVFTFTNGNTTINAPFVNYPIYMIMFLNK